MSRLQLVPLAPDRAADFHDVLGRASHESRRCLCTAAFVESWNDPAAAARCRAQRMAQGRTDGFLLYRDGAPIGWCQAAPREELPLILRGRNLPPEPGAWAITCLALVPEARGQGQAHELLRLVLEALRARGVRRVQAFACRYGPEEDTGAFVEFPESLCRTAGMALEHDHPMRPVYAATLG